MRDENKLFQKLLNLKKMGKEIYKTKVKVILITLINKIIESK